MLSHTLSQIYLTSIKTANFYRAFSDCPKVPVFGLQTQIRHASSDVDKNSSKAKDGSAAKEYRPTMNDPYRIKEPYLDVKLVLESNAKAALDCKTADKRNICMEKMKDKPLKPVPPSQPFPWQRYLLFFAILFGASGLLYKAYEKKMKDYFVLNSSNIWAPRKFTRKPLKLYELPRKTQYLIIGAGTAGVAAYKAITKHDKKAMVLFISDEDIIPYDKRHLSKGLWTSPELDVKKLTFMDGKKEQSCLYFDSSIFMDQKKFSELKEGPAVAIASGWLINRVDADEHKAYISSNMGETFIEYKKCLIAAGSRPMDLRFLENMSEEVNSRICRLRTVRDLETVMVKVRRARKVVIVGDGCIAMDLAYSLKNTDKHLDIEDELNVTLVIPGTGVFSNIIPDYLAQWAAEMVQIEGIKLITESEVLDCYATTSPDNASDKILTMYLSNGKEISADYVFLALGAVPRTEMAKVSFLETDKERGGYIVNTELMARTDLYVAGDCASLYDKNNNRVRYEHHSSAVETGCLAGRNMTGDMKPFAQPPSHTVKFGKSILLKSFGQTHPKFDTVGVFTTCTVDQTQLDTDKRPPEQQGEEPCFKRMEEYKKKFQKGVVFYLRDNAVIGLVLWNLDGKDKIAMEILSNKPQHEDIEALVKKLEIHKDNCCSDC